MKKFLCITVTTLVVSGVSVVNAGGWLDKLGDIAEDAAKNATERNVERKADTGVDKALNPDLKSIKGKRGGGSQSSSRQSDASQDNTDASQTSSKKALAPESAGFQKSDFVRGAEIIFQDEVVGEQVGEFPSKWDLERGNAEIAVVGGKQAIAMDKEDCWIKPLMTDNSTNYLGDVFTVEWDMLYDDTPKDGAPRYEIDFMAPNEGRAQEIFELNFWSGGDEQDYSILYVKNGSASNTDKQGEGRGKAAVANNDGRWHHYALSFNKRALKFYFDGQRVINIPNAKAGAGWMTFWSGGAPLNTFLKNVIIAKGAKDLYGQQSTDAITSTNVTSGNAPATTSAAVIEKQMKETGKFVTNNILFETGKADLKTESMIEIMRVAEYMKANPRARFEVQGHTDNQGSNAINDPLSQKRAETIVKALVSLGIDEWNLKAVGKGSHEPVADNSTAEGRAKNRRVEFIKK